MAILDTARRGANSVFEYIERTAEVVPDGVRWQTLSYYNEPHYDTNLYTGVAGISLFLSDYYRLTGNTTARDLAASALRWCIAPDRPPGTGPQRIPLPLSLYFGASGLGLAWLRLALATGDAGALGEPAHLTTAKAAGETTYAYGDVRSNPSQCHGLAGSAELFLPLYRLTREQVWLERAHDFAVQALGYRTSTPSGDVWRADDPGCYSPDFFCGAAGVGHFFLRLQAPDQLELPFA